MPFKNPHPLYSTWQGMHQRCSNPNIAQWKDYGGRGVQVCESWYSFDRFAHDMGDRPSPLHTLDRIDNDLGYYPKNCRWATRKEQQRNRRGALYVEIEGRSYLLAALAEEHSLKAETITGRVKRGLSFADAVRKERYWGGGPTPGSRPRKTHCPKGHEYTPENSIIINVAKKTRSCRICHNERQRLKYAADRSTLHE